MQLFKTKQQRGARRIGKTVRASGGFAFFRVAALFVAVILTLPFLPLRLSMAAEDSFDITVKTTWVDNENNARIRPSFVTIGLMANGVPAVHKNGDPVASQNLDHENGWTCVFGSLPTVDGAGSAIEYTLVQTNLNSDYTTDFEPTTLTWLSYTSEIEVINTTEEGVLKGQLIVTKQDRETDEPLPGATFSLTLNGSAKTYTGTTDENGEYVFVVPLGEYTLIESKAPAGYQADSTVYTVKLIEGADGGVTPSSVRSRAPRRGPAATATLIDSGFLWQHGSNVRCEWKYYDDGTLILAPESGDTAYVNCASGAVSTGTSITAKEGWPWNAYRDHIKRFECEGTVYFGAASGTESTINGMFMDCVALETCDLNGCDFSDVKYMRDVFNGCTALKSIPGATDVFGNCPRLGFAERLFKNCASLSGTLDLSNFVHRDTTPGCRLDEMFAGCESLVTIIAPNLVCSSNASGLVDNCTSLDRLVLTNLKMSSGTINTKTLYALSYIDASSARLKLLSNADLNSANFFTDGVWTRSSNGKKYTAHELCELVRDSEGGSLYLPASIYEKTMDHVPGFEKISQTDYVINNLGAYSITVDETNKDNFQLYKNGNTTYLYSKSQSKENWASQDDDNYVLTGPVTIRLYNAATDMYGALHDVVVTINKFTITNIASGNIKVGDSHSDYKRLLLEINDQGLFKLCNYNVASSTTSGRGSPTVNSGDSGTYADISLQIDGAKEGETFLFFVNDLDLHVGSGASGSPTAGVHYSQYGVEGCEGIWLGSGFDLDTVALSEPTEDSTDSYGTALRRYDGFGTGTLTESADGRYIIGSQTDYASHYSKFFVCADAHGVGEDSKGSNFIWTSGNACDTRLLEKEGALVPIDFFKIDADTGDRRPLNGAILKVTSEDGSRMFNQWVTEGSKKTLFLMSGRYMLKEAYAPNGRKIASDINFRVLDNGRILVNGVLQDEFVGINACVVMENRYPVTLTHTVYNAKLTTLTIYRPDGMEEQDFWYTVTEGTASVQVCIPAGEDHVTLSGIVSGRTYVVTERDWSWRYRLDATMDNDHLTTAGKPYYQTQDPVNGVYRNLPVKVGDYAARLTAVNDPQRNTVAYSGPRVDNEWLSGIERETNIFTLRVSDPVTHENWINYLARNTEYTGRVWADKSVTAEAEITVGALGYAPVTVRKTTGADFLVDFSLLSSTVNEMIPGAIYEEGSPLKQNPGETAYVTYTDHLGPYMTAVNMNKLVYGNNAYTVKYDAANSTETKDVYTVEGTVTSDLTGEPCSLSDIIIEVEHSADLATGDTVTVKVPDYLIPMRVFNVRDNEGQTQMSIDRIRPLHLFYSVDPKHELKDHVRGDNLMTGSDLDAWNTYFTDPANAGEGGKTVKFYATDPAQGAQVQYVPSDKNHFSFFVNDTPLYDDDHQYATTPPDENGDPTFDLTKYHYHVYHYEFYDATLSTGELPQSGQWYDARRVNDTVGARYEMVDGVNISPEIVWDSENGYWKIPAGVFKEIHRYTMESQKTENITGTDTFVYSNTMDPAHNLTGTFGNNGVVFVDKQLQ